MQNNNNRKKDNDNTTAINLRENYSANINNLFFFSIIFNKIGSLKALMRLTTVRASYSVHCIYIKDIYCN